MQSIGVHNIHAHTKVDSITFSAADGLAAWQPGHPSDPAQDVDGVEWIYMHTFDERER